MISPRPSFLGSKYPKYKGQDSLYSPSLITVTLPRLRRKLPKKSFCAKPCAHNARFRPWTERQRRVGNCVPHPLPGTARMAAKCLIFSALTGRSVVEIQLRSVGWRSAGAWCRLVKAFTIDEGPSKLEWEDCGACRFKRALAMHLGGLKFVQWTSSNRGRIMWEMIV